MLHQGPWMGVQILEHGDSFDALVDQAAPAVDFHDLPGRRGGDAGIMDGVGDPGLVFDPMGRAPIEIKL